jgi:DNA-binding transcriptional ArsR family regulator
MKKHELEMAEFFEVLKAPQSRRIVEKLAIKEMSIEALVRSTKLSHRSIELHLEPLIRAKLVSKSKAGKLKLNWRKFNQNSDWFKSF